MIRVPLKGTYNLQPYEIDLSIPAMKVLKKLPEKMPAEVIDNTLYVMEPSPSYYHADVSSVLMYRIQRYVNQNKLGKVFKEDLGLFGKGTLVRPDIVFVSNKSMRRIAPKGLIGPADLCIEVLSPSTRAYNFKTKKKLYEKFGVNEYWLVDPIKKDAHGFLLKNGKYGDPLILKGKINIRILNKSIKF